MRKFIVGRLLSIIPVLIIVSVVIFSVVHLTPGDPAASILGDEATVEDIAALRAKMGLDKPGGRAVFCLDRKYLPRRFRHECCRQ